MVVGEFNIEEHISGSFCREGLFGRVYLKDNLALKIHKKKNREQLRRKSEEFVAGAFTREIEIFKIVSGLPHFPKLIDYDKNEKWILMSRHGDPMSKENGPCKKVFDKQMEEILSILNQNKIENKCISRGNLLWDGSMIVMIDFESCYIKDKPKNKFTPGLKRAIKILFN